jgi:sulfoxide reductase heme-binding subunit YedZ
MSVNYAPVLWNRQKRRYDIILWGLIALYLAVFIGLQAAWHPNITPETLIIRATGTLAFLLLHVILCIGPLARIDQRFLPLLYNRRHLGVSMFLIAFTHGVFNLVQFHALGDVNPLLSLFLSNTDYGSFPHFPFQTLGFFALLILFLMAATSHDFWLKNLGPRVWKSLHMMVYVAYALLVLHVLLGVVQQERATTGLVLIALGFTLVSGLHWYAGRLEKRGSRQSPAPEDEGFVYVCEVEHIQNNRAKVVLINGENIAIFKYDGRLSALSNICRHQNGPLGEGRIVDGCITCPWHGYQYLPRNGQSPPPFTEKLETYDLRLLGSRIYVHPRPYAPGTERPAPEIA